MLTIISKRQTILTERYVRGYSWDSPNSGSGFSFDCDRNGRIDESTLSDCAKANLAMCRLGRSDDGTIIVDDGIRHWTDTYSQPAVGRCSCGGEVHLSDSLDNLCQCGLCYNMSGRRVIPSWECDAYGEPIDE